MKTALDIDASLLDEGERNFVEKIREHGWIETHIAQDAAGPGFSYTTGFWLKFELPELMLFSLPQEISHDIFWNFFHDLNEGKRFATNEPVSDILTGFDVILKPVLVENFAEHFGWSRWFYGGDSFQVLQIFFPDKQGRFPWEDEVREGFGKLQPDLSEPSG